MADTQLPAEEIGRLRDRSKTRGRRDRRSDRLVPDPRGTNHRMPAYDKEILTMTLSFCAVPTAFGDVPITAVQDHGRPRSQGR
jgi:hypothetical protein